MSRAIWPSLRSWAARSRLAKRAAHERGIGVAEVEFDLAVADPQRVRAHVLVAEEAAAVAEIELEVVPDAGDHTALELTPDQRVTLVRASIVDSERLALVGAEHGDSALAVGEEAGLAGGDFSEGERRDPGFAGGGHEGMIDARAV